MCWAAGLGEGEKGRGGVTGRRAARRDYGGRSEGRPLEILRDAGTRSSAKVEAAPLDARRLAFGAEPRRSVATATEVRLIGVVALEARAEISKSRDGGAARNAGAGV